MSEKRTKLISSALCGVWQHMDTAPKGKNVLLYDEEEDEPCVVGRLGSNADGDECWVNVIDQFWLMPTAWMPLPTDPNAQADRSEP